MSRIAGVVSCKAGWYVLRETPLPGPWHWSVEPTFDDAMQKLENYDVIAIDVPLSGYESESSGTPEEGIHNRYRRPSDSR